MKACSAAPFRTTVREMTPADYEEALALWKSSEGIGLSAADSKEHVERYLFRNPGLSFVAFVERELAGAVLSGHDGRRGTIHHLVVKDSFRRKGIGRSLVEHCEKALVQAGITKCHVFVFTDNLEATGFWKKMGWFERSELLMFSRNLDSIAV
jgi:ribosomal protein S18 acetylase RimI-like enzyme